MFQGLEVIGIVRHRLVVAGVLFRRLAPEALGLVLGIVQLRETVRDLLAGDEELEAVGDKRSRSFWRASGETSVG